MTVWFQDGVTYGGADMARYNTHLLGDNNGAHILFGAPDFTATANQEQRKVTVSSGRVAVYGTGRYEIGEVSTATVVDIPPASSLNPRRDLIIGRVGAGGAFTVELLQGTPMASPVAPSRPAKSVALAWVDVPKSMTTFTVTATRYTGQYTDQILATATGGFAVKWGGLLPSASGYRPGAEVYCMTHNQRWVRTDAGTWYTTDPGPWRRCTPKNVTAEDGTSVTVSGDLYVREDSARWEFSGQLTFSPSKNIGALVRIALVPDSISRPTQNTYGAAGQSYGSTSSGAVGRFGYMTNGEIEYGNDGTLGNLYCNVQLSKSLHNT